jgi:hypothetical protein
LASHGNKVCRLRNLRSDRKPTPAKIKIDRSPVLTLWSVAVAEYLGRSRSTALAVGKPLLE